MIQVENLTKRFGRHTAVSEASFGVDRGEVAGFLGPNGAGKTTTIRILAGFLPPTSGSARIAGFDVARQSLEARRHIGYLPETAPLYREMRVREYLRFRAQLKGLRGERLRHSLDEVVERCGLQNVRRAMIKTLSRGFQQRVGLADALVHSPPLLILDEPTNGLDPNQIRSIRRLIRRLGADHTILVSTHILSEAEMLCDKIVIIDDGRIRAADSPEKLIGAMRAAGRVSIDLRAPAAEVEPVLAQLPYVKRVTHDGTEPPWEQFSILVESGTDAREAIYDLCRRRDWPLRSLYRHDTTLEDVFVELTRKD